MPMAHRWQVLESLRRKSRGIAKKGSAAFDFPEAVQAGEQFKLRAVRIISRDPLILQDSQQEPKQSKDEFGAMLLSTPRIGYFARLFRPDCF
jgi:hypothetical protein